MVSLWRDREPVVVPEAPWAQETFDCVVVGAGPTGLTTALLLAREGRRVAVVEARSVGACATGNTSAKISLLQGTHVSQVGRRHSAAATRSYVAANRAGQEWLIDFCEEHGVPTQRADAVTYAGSESATDQVQEEFASARASGLDVEWAEDLELPYPTYGAVRLRDQWQCDPMDVLAAMTDAAVAAGVAIFEHARVRGVRGEVVHTERGDLRARQVVLGTGTPILDRGAYFARLEPKRSYVVAFQIASEPPRSMYLSADEPVRSLRYAPSARGDLLLVGGSGHPVGRQKAGAHPYRELIEWTREHFPGAEPTHRWSAQDYSSIDELPYVGPLLPGSSITVATGYAKWGMTNAVAAALMIAGTGTDRGPYWADAFRPWRPSELTSADRFAEANVKVARDLVGGWTGAAVTSPGPPPEEGEGRVERRGVRRVGTCTVDGATSTVGAVCPHLAGILRWNSEEHTWDCPLHGSRFSHRGEVLEGPATRDLPRYE